ncbi:hypothetical protein V1511DRAFT_184089 [Dipodascopsis uninucleata]
MLFLSSFVRLKAAGINSLALFNQAPSVISMFVREKSTYKMKTHKAAAARWIKRGSGGFKHGPVGVNHGNTGWSASGRSRYHRGGFAKGPGEGNHVKRLKRLLPYAGYK